MDKFGKNVKNTYITYRSTILTSLTTGVVVITALAWSELLEEIIKYYYPNDKNNIRSKLYYALFITVILVLFQIYLFPHFNLEDNQCHNIESNIKTK